MMAETSVQAISVFLVVVAAVLALSFYFARKTKSASGYYAAGGQIPWAVNGIAFAGDYLSAASFLGICGMIAVYGYDGFLYSIGYLAGWIVALFVVAEAMKRLGIKPIMHPIRGGTDGSRLSFMGLPTPNIFAGEHSFHSKTEWVAVQDMEMAVKVIVEIAKVWEEKS